MQLFHSYTEAFHHAFENKTCAAAHLFRLKADINIDTSGCYKLFVCLSGGKTFRISDCSYTCAPGDIFLISPTDWHYFSGYREEDPHERYIFFIHPQFLGRCSSDETDLRSCFVQAGESRRHKLTPTPEERQRLLSCMHRLTNSTGFGADLLEQAYMLELLVLVNRLYFSKTATAAPLPREHYPETVMNVIAYLHAHLTEELQGEKLERQFALSYAHLNRLFKSATGFTVHRYVTTQRLSLAKELLGRGLSVTETCLACGFGDYGNFIKTFTAAVGCTPKKYAELARE